MMLFTDISGMKMKQYPKELTGTSAQLEQAAKAKGLSKAEYKKQLEAAGYTVKEK